MLSRRRLQALSDNNTARIPEAVFEPCSFGFGRKLYEMAALPLDDCDGIFIERDTTLEALDEVDSSRVFEIVREKDIPMKYFLHKIFSPMLDSMHSFQRRSEQPSRYRLVSRCVFLSKHVRVVADNTSLLVGASSLRLRACLHSKLTPFPTSKRPNKSTGTIIR